MSIRKTSHIGQPSPQDAFEIFLVFFMMLLKKEKNYKFMKKILGD